MEMLSEFLQLLRDQVDKGIYVWGGNGENLSEMQNPVAWIKRHESNEKDEKRAIALYRKRVTAGVSDIRAFDCSGLVYWGLHALGLQTSDVSSRGLYALCNPVKKGQLRPGDLVFHHDGKQIVHVGVWAHNGYQIECLGRDVGVVQNKRRSRYWNRFGRLKAFDDEPTPERKCRVYVKGKRVNVRDVDHVPMDKKRKEDTIIGVAHRGDTYPYIAIAPTGWYKIDYKGTFGYISCRTDLTELR